MIFHENRLPYLLFLKKAATFEIHVLQIIGGRFKGQEKMYLKMSSAEVVCCI